MKTTQATPEEIRVQSALGDSGQVFHLGCFAQRVTIYSQQVRALNLAWALSELSVLREGTDVVVVGAGASGLTAAIGFARRGASVTVLERAEVLLPRFSGSTQRYVHPHAYDWPAPGSEIRRAGLPVMDWTAGLAAEVVRQLKRAWMVESAGLNNLTVRLRTDVTGVDRERSAITCGDGEVLNFDILVLAVGVGTERRLDGTPGYWDNDALAQDFNGPARVLVSGNGDGALVDLVRASLLDFDHAQLMMQFQSFSGTYDLAERVLEVEIAAAKDPAFDLDAAFSRLALDRVSHFLSSRRRERRAVTWNTGPKRFRRNTMALNRVLVESLRRLGLDHWEGEIARCIRASEQWDVTLQTGADRHFDLAVRRWGPENDLVKLIPGIPTSSRKEPPGGDLARVPHWPDGYFASSRAVPASTPTAFDVVPLEEGFGLESRAWWMNNRGEVVGWTLLPEARDHAFFVWSGSGLPPTLGCIPGLSKMSAMSINDRGEYVICSKGGGGQAILIGPGKATVLAARGERAMPYSVNNRSEVVGWSDDADSGLIRPCLWRDGAPEFLEDCGFGGVALQINEQGDIVGEVSLDQAGHLAAARWRSGKLERFMPPKPYYSARCFRINNHGLAVGYLMRNGQSSDFFLWRPGSEPEVLGQGEAYGVNDSGWVACRSGKRGAFLYRDGVTVWLDDLIDKQWHIVWPFCLAEDLRMVGVGRRAGIERAILLVPRTR